MVIHNFRTVDETRYMLLVMAEKRVGKPQKLKTDLAITIQPWTLRWREAESLYKTVIKLEVKVNDRPDLVHRPQGERFNPQYMSTCKRSGRVSAHCWGWISHEGAGIPHPTEGHLDGLHYEHILENITVPSVWMLYPKFLIHLHTLPFMILAVAFRTHTTHKGQTPMPPVGFEPTISAGEGP